MTLTAMIVGLLINLFTQFIKTNESKLTGWITPERTKTINAVIALLSVATGIMVASQTPGGLASMDWQHIVTTVAEASLIIGSAAIATYHTLVKPVAKKLEEKASKSE